MKSRIINRRSGNRSSLQRGSITLILVVGLIMFSALIAGMVYLSSSSIRETVSSIQSLNAWGLAEAGYRYMAVNYKETSDINNSQTADDEKNAFLKSINGRTYTITNRGSFHLTVRPYYFSNLSGPTGDTLTSITVHLPGTTPAGFTMPATGKIKIGDDNPDNPGMFSVRDYTSGTFNATTGQFQCTVPSSTIKTGDSVYLVLNPNGVQNIPTGGNLNLNLAASGYSASNFPAKNGFIHIVTGSDSPFYRYKQAVVETADVLTLKNLRHIPSTGYPDGKPFAINISVDATTPVTFKKFIVIQSRGQVGAEQRTLSFYQAISDSVLVTPVDIFKLDTLASLDANFSKSAEIGTNYSTETLYVSGGGSAILSNIQALASTIRGGGGMLNDYKCGAFWYSNTTKINDNWLATGGILNYDVQVKLGTGNKLNDGTLGLAIRARNASPNTYLAITFMQYNLATLYFDNGGEDGTAIVAGNTITGAHSGASAIVQGAPELTAGSWTGGDAAGKLRLVSVSGSFDNAEDLKVNGDILAKVDANNYEPASANDYIPNEIKPKYDNFSPYNHSIGPLLMVLWERKSDGTFRWLAYKDITSDYYVRGSQDWKKPEGSCTGGGCKGYDGQIVNDAASLLIRVKEKREVLVTGQPQVKFNDINVFYGDDSARYTSPARPGNSIAYDIKENRRRYPIGSAASFPTWPPKWLEGWEPAVDYFSHIENPGGTQPQFQWDAVNPNITDIDVLQILTDGTLRLTELVTPEATFGATYQQPEIGMIACGDVKSSPFSWASFADFAFKIGVEGNKYGGFSGTEMAWE